MICLKLLEPCRELGDNFGMGETLFVFVFWPNLLASWRPGCVLCQAPGCWSELVLATMWYGTCTQVGHL